ncbi:MAG: MMPL family transporter [Myxococcota bacterium]|nr:MMPL family transporter [Myxococcota bacterium]
MQTIARILVTKRKPVLALTALVTLTAVTMLFRMDFNADVTSFMLEGNDRGREFAALQEKYDSGDPIMVMFQRQEGWDNRAGLQTLLEVRTGLAAVEGVKSVGMVVPEHHPLTGSPLDAAALQSLPDAVLHQITDGPVASFLLSGDGKATMAAVLPTGDPIKVARRVMKTEMPEDVQVSFAGNPVVFASVIDMLGWFLLAIPPSVIVLLLLVFAANIGSRKLAALSIVPAVLGSLWTFGLIFGLGYRVDIVTVIVPIFVIVMGSADGLHFVTHLQESARTTPDPVARTAAALREVGVPMILTTISTAAGFLSLLVTDVGPIRQLGLFVAVGISFAGVASFFSLPALLAGIEIPQPSEHAIGGRLTAALKKVARYPAIAGLVAAMLMAFAVLTLPGLAVNPDQLFFFQDDHPVRTSFGKLTDTFGGGTPMFGELVVDPARPLEEQLPALREVSAELAALDGVQRVLSVLDLVEGVPPAMRARALSGEQSGALGRMVSEDGLRFVLFPGSFTTEQLQAWVDWAEDKEEVRVLTGMPLLFDEMSRLVLWAQLKSLAAAFALVFLLLLIAYRRLELTFTAMIPLGLTCAVLLGFIAVSGIQLHLLTAIISAIVIGVGIDYAIHLVAAIEHARAKGPGYVLRGIDKAGRPILANALGIAVGMSALLLSPLKPHNQIAVIMWVSMITAAVTALLVIPAMIAMEDRASIASANSAPPPGGVPEVERGADAEGKAQDKANQGEDPA